MLDGLDEALTGMSAGETKTFSAELAGGKLAGTWPQVTVTVEQRQGQGAARAGR